MVTTSQGPPGGESEGEQEFSTEDKLALADHASKTAITLAKAGLHVIADIAADLAKQLLADVEAPAAPAEEPGATDNEREGECPEALEQLDAPCPFRADLRGTAQEQAPTAEAAPGAAAAPPGTV